jgi:hypothetical protein
VEELICKPYVEEVNPFLSISKSRSLLVHCAKLVERGKNDKKILSKSKTNLRRE